MGSKRSTSWCDLVLTFDLAVVTLTFFSGNISETVKCKKLKLDSILLRGCRCAT